MWTNTETNIVPWLNQRRKQTQILTVNRCTDYGWQYQCLPSVAISHNTIPKGHLRRDQSIHLFLAQLLIESLTRHCTRYTICLRQTLELIPYIWSFITRWSNHRHRLPEFKMALLDIEYSMAVSCDPSMSTESCLTGTRLHLDKITLCTRLTNYSTTKRHLWN